LVSAKPKYCRKIAAEVCYKADAITNWAFPFRQIRCRPTIGFKRVFWNVAVSLRPRLIS